MPPLPTLEEISAAGQRGVRDIGVNAEALWAALFSKQGPARPPAPAPLEAHPDNVMAGMSQALAAQSQGARVPGAPSAPAAPQSPPFSVMGVGNGMLDYQNQQDMFAADPIAAPPEDLGPRLAAVRAEALRAAAPGMDDAQGASYLLDQRREIARKAAEQQAGNQRYAQLAAMLAKESPDALEGRFNALPLRRGAGTIREVGDPLMAEALYDRFKAMGLNVGRDDRGGLSVMEPSSTAGDVAPSSQPLPAQYQGGGGGRDLGKVLLNLQRLKQLEGSESITPEAMAFLRAQAQGQVDGLKQPTYADNLGGFLDEMAGAAGGSANSANPRAQAMVERLQQAALRNPKIKRLLTQSEIYKAWAHMYGIGKRR